jgi:hypothetical protein
MKRTKNKAIKLQNSTRKHTKRPDDVGKRLSRGAELGHPLKNPPLTDKADVVGCEPLMRQAASISRIVSVWLKRLERSQLTLHDYNNDRNHNSDQNDYS